MDLDRCPKCAEPWHKGSEICRKCRFVPIGAGLSAAPKKKKRKVKYRDPGSATGFLSFAFLAISGFGAVKYQPWTDDWEFFRSLIGQGRHHSLRGEWEVIRSLVLSKKSESLIAKTGIDHSLFNFDGKSVSVRLVKGELETKAKGSYEVQGELLTVRGLVPSGEEAGSLPRQFVMKLAWNGPDTLVAQIAGKEALYLRRKSGGELSRFFSMAIKPGSKNDLPGEMRGIIAQMESAGKEASQ